MFLPRGDEGAHSRVEGGLIMNMNLGALAGGRGSMMI